MNKKKMLKGFVHRRKSGKYFYGEIRESTTQLLLHYGYAPVLGH
jgi:hypothetical protein